MPRVSIVLPTYNGERYIRQSVDSIINQTFTDWELILVDDCSTDSIPIILDEYASKDERISVIHNKVNKKLPESLNIGFDCSKGQYFTWTSDDNYYMPDAIEEMVCYLDNNKEQMVCANMEFIDSEDNNSGVLYKYNDLDMCFNDCVGACFMYRRQVLSDIGRYDASWFLVEDYEYWLRILFRYGKIGHLDKMLYRYRYHANSLTGKRKNEIQEQLAKLRIVYKNPIIHNLKNDKRKLTAIYYQQREIGISDSEMEREIRTCVPELEKEYILNEQKKVVVFGAGEYGRRAYSALGKKIAYYVDSDSKKIGTKFNDIEIISINDLIKLVGEYQILIAVSEEKVIDIINLLVGREISGYSVFQSIRKDCSICQNSV